MMTLIDGRKIRGFSTLLLHAQGCDCDDCVFARMKETPSLMDAFMNKRQFIQQYVLARVAIGADVDAVEVAEAAWNAIEAACK